MRTGLVSISALSLLLAGCAVVDVEEHYVDTQVVYDVGPAETSLGLPFSKSVAVGDIIFLSGELGILSGEGLPVEGGAGPETTQIFRNIERTLSRHDAGLEDIVKCTVVLEDMADYTAMNDAYRVALPEPMPARSTFGVDGIALGASLEIECIAVKP